jgi:hypothetical protein
MMKKIAASCFIFIAFVSFTYAQQIAFPGAEGYGKYSTGGRGGFVAEVTNLNDTGTGSLRWALDQHVDTIYVFKDAANPNFPITVYQPLTVVFSVSGFIHLKSDLRIKRDNLTIAGQTAPCDGICIAGRSVLLNGATTSQLFYWGPRRKNIIVRHMRFRPGVPLDTSGVPTTAFVTYGLDVENYENVMIDHCSMSWANEECMAIYDNKYTTVQWSIASEGLYNAYHIKGIRGYGGVWGGQFASYHHNFIAHQNNRTPRFGGARAHDTTALVEYVNNVNYNWVSSSATYGGDVEVNGGIARLNEMNNYYKPGPATPSTHKLVRPDYSANAMGVGRFHVQGNIIEGNAARTADNWLAVDFVNIPVASRDSSRSDTAFTIGRPVNMEPALNAFDTVLKSAGAIFPRRDSVDMRLMNEVSTGTTTGTGSSGKPGIIDAPSAVGGWPVYATCTGPDDNDHDGMPDEWEIENGLNPNVADDRNIVGGDGYTMLEKYLNNIIPNLVSQKLCPGTGNFTLESDRRGNTYQWEENTGNGFIAITGQTDSVITLQLTTMAYGNQYRCKINNNGYSRQFKIKFESTWNGSVDNTWENAANWSCNVVPNRYTDVVIPSGNVTINSNAECRSIRVNANAAQVTVGTGHNLLVAH